MEQYYVNSFQNANWFKKKKKIDSECYSEGLTCVILTKKKKCARNSGHSYNLNENAHNLLAPSV